MKLTPLFNVTLDDVSEPGKHWYKIDRPGYEKLPGVTTPLNLHDKPGLLTWSRNLACDTILRDAKAQHVRGRISTPALEEIVAKARKRPDRERDEAAALGILVHGFLDKFSHGEAVRPQDMPEETRPALSAFVSWWEKQDLEFLAGDTKVGSLVHYYGGSLDALMRRRSDKKILLIDYKTSNHTYDTHALQAAGGYHIGLEETYGIYADEAWVLRFSKKLPVKFADYQVQDIERSRRAWLLTLELWREMQTSHFVPKRIRKPKETGETKPCPA